MSILSRRWIFLKYGLWSKYIVPRLQYRDYEFKQDNVKRIQDFLSRFNTDIAATFVGLKQIKHSLGLEDAFEQTFSLLSEVYGSIIVPTFTYSVRNTGTYDVLNSQSELGAFSKLFINRADFRSLAPIKSYAIKGQASEEFAKLNYCDDYESNGSYEYFKTAKTVTINIGTDVLRPVRTHQLEYLLKVPYVKKIWRPVTVIDQYRRQHSIQVADLAPKGTPIKLNCSKWERDLLANGFLHHLKINDLLIRVLPDESYADFFSEQIKKNPYYLVD